MNNSSQMTVNNKEIKGTPAHLKVAFVANLPLFLLPLVMWIGSHSDSFIDDSGADWSGLMSFIGLLLWVPAILGSLILLLFSGRKTEFSKIVAIVSIIYGITVAGFLYYWIFF